MTRIDWSKSGNAKNKGTDEDSSVEFEIDGKVHILNVEKINEAFGLPLQMMIPIEILQMMQL